jgi:hypothetical protein
MLSRLFRLHPEIEEGVIKSFLSRRKDQAEEPRISIKSVHHRFIQLCRNAGIPETEYPFNVDYRGKRSLSVYLKGLFDTDTKKAVGAHGGPDARKMLSVGTGAATTNAVMAAYQIAEIDGHYVDVHAVLKVPNPQGGYILHEIERIWILALRERYTKNALGFCTSYARNYSKEDVLRCIRSAVVPWKRRELTTPGLRYHDTAGMPSESVPEARWAVPSEILFDNANAHLAHQVRDRLGLTLGCSVNAGPVGTPQRRALIESFFHLLAANGFHRLPSTAGSHPRDGRRAKDPAKEAKRFEITLDQVEDLVHVLILNYNGTPQAPLNGRSPLEYLRFLANQERVLIRQVAENDRAKLDLLHFQHECTVRGSAVKGRRPYIQFQNVRYTGAVINSAFSLINTKLRISVDPEDSRTVRAFLPNGLELGTLSAMGPWGRDKHGLLTRRIAHRESAKIVTKHYTDNSEPVHDLLGHLNVKAKTSRRAANEYATVAREAGLPTDYVPPAPAENARTSPPKKRPLEIKPLKSGNSMILL